MSKIKIYHITGPTDDEKSIETFLSIQNRLINIGYIVTTALEIGNDGAQRIAAMLKADFLVVLDDFIRCPVSTAEVQMGKQMGMTIYHHATIDALLTKLESLLSD